MIQTLNRLRAKSTFSSRILRSVAKSISTGWLSPTGVFTSVAPSDEGHDGVIARIHPGLTTYPAIEDHGYSRIYCTGQTIQVECIPEKMPLVQRFVNANADPKYKTLVIDFPHGGERVFALHKSYTKEQTHQGQACKPGWSASRTGCIPASGSNSPQSREDFMRENMPSTMAAQPRGDKLPESVLSGPKVVGQPGVLSRLAGHTAISAGKGVASLFKRAYQALTQPKQEQEQPKDTTEYSGSYAHHTKNATNRLTAMGVKNPWATNLQTSPALRSVAIKDPNGFDNSVRSIGDSLNQALRFSEEPATAATVKGKLEELNKLAKDVSAFRAKNTPEEPDIDIRLPIPGEKKPRPNYGRKGSGAANTLHAVEHLAKGGSVKSAVASVMKFGGVKEATAQRHVRKAVKTAADSADAEIARLKKLVGNEP